MNVKHNRSSLPIRQASVAANITAASSVWEGLCSGATADARKRRVRRPDRAPPGSCWRHTASAPSCVPLPRRKRDQSPRHWPRRSLPLYRHPERPQDSSRCDSHCARAPPARQSLHSKTSEKSDPGSAESRFHLSRSIISHSTGASTSRWSPRSLIDAFTTVNLRGQECSPVRS
jgi:hypothetical protein